MLYVVVLALIILWLLGLLTSPTMSVFVHIPLVIAITLILVNLVLDRNRVS